MSVLDEKFEALRGSLRGLGSVAVAYSAGVDSTLLLRVAADVLGERAVAVTVDGASVPRREVEEAREFCAQNGIRLLVLPLDQLDIRGFRENPRDRCYYCKKSIFTAIKEAAEREGLACVADGSNVDDLSDYRPGLRAISELGIKTPLKDAGLTKAEIRQLSKQLGLRTHDKPSFACLASRIPYGVEITAEDLRRAELGEEALRGLGFTQYRVRIHGSVARIELLPEEMPRMLLPEVSSAVSERFEELGFAFTALDLRGYRVGAMNLVKSE